MTNLPGLLRVAKSGEQWLRVSAPPRLTWHERRSVQGCYWPNCRR